MKRFHFSIFLLAGVFMVGCQDQFAIQESVLPDGLGTKGEEITVQTNERYVFPAEKDYKAWVDIVTLEDRLSACEVPENLLHSMTTDALVRTVLNYPLNFIYSAYNDPTVAVDIIVKNSPLHQELFNRGDAAETLLRYFDQSCISKGRVESMINPGETSLTYGNEMFFDYLLASRLDSGLFSERDKESLRAIARRKLAERQADAETFSEVSLAPLRMIANDSSEGAQTRTYTFWYWYTPFGYKFNVEERTEMTRTEIWYSTWYYTNNYITDAGMHAMASNCYNGNGYAWMINDPTAGSPNSATTSNSWLEDGGDTGNTISNLWTDAFYDTATSSTAEKIYYNGSDHTAIPYSGTRYISKWGSGPLMEHEPTYCPYLSSNMEYYRVRTTSLLRYDLISGPGMVVANVTNNYNVQPNILSWRGITSTEWTGRGLSPGTPSSFSFSGAPNSSSCTLICYEPGTYSIKIEGKYNGNVIVECTSSIMCWTY